MTFSRREFLDRALKSGLLLGGAATFGGLGPFSRLAMAAGPNSGLSSLPTEKDHYYIFCYFSGAWDVLLSLDPREPIKFHAGNLSKTRIEPNYNGLDDDNAPNGGKLVDVKGKNGKPEQLGWYIGDLAKHQGTVPVEPKTEVPHSYVSRTNSGKVGVDYNHSNFKL